MLCKEINKYLKGSFTFMHLRKRLGLVTDAVRQRPSVYIREAPKMSFGRHSIALGVC